MKGVEWIEEKEGIPANHVVFGATMEGTFVEGRDIPFHLSSIVNKYLLPLLLPPLFSLLSPSFSSSFLSSLLYSFREMRRG